MSKTLQKTRQMTGLAILSALIIVLQIACTFIKFGPVSITLALVPIIIGAAIYQGYAGAILGFVLGAIVLISGFAGWDGGFVLYLFDSNPVALIIVVLLKSTLAGFLAQKIYQWLAPKKEKLAVLIAGIACPIINTGVFILGMFLFWYPVLTGFAESSGQGVVLYALTGLVGINFLIELVVNVILSSTITYIIQVIRKGRT